MCTLICAASTGVRLNGRRLNIGDIEMEIGDGDAMRIGKKRFVRFIKR